MTTIPRPTGCGNLNEKQEKLLQKQALISDKISIFNNKIDR